MVLSQGQLEEIAAATLKDFYETVHRKPVAKFRFAQATPIEQFARAYLGLSISYAHLSCDGSICGLTAYTDTEYQVQEMGMTRTIPLKQNQILLDTSFIEPYQAQKLLGKKRFTLAHECAHQILFQLATDELRQSCKSRYCDRPAYSLRDLKTREDWNEWQANVVGAALIMPQSEVDRAMWYLTQSKPIKNYEGRFSYHDRTIITVFCHALEVSKTAALIRLRQLGYIEDHPYSEYVDPLEVWA